MDAARIVVLRGDGGTQETGEVRKERRGPR